MTAGPGSASSAVVADTHALVWYLAEPARLSPLASAAFDAAAAYGDPVWVPAICLVEITYLCERGRVPAAALDLLCDALRDPTSVLRFAPLDLEVIDALAQVPRDAVPDMPDRIIAATGAALGLPLITRDHRIRSLPIPTLW